MSALGKTEIVNRLVTRDLVISPILSSDQIGSSSVDLRVGTVVLLARAGRQSHVDPSAYKAARAHEGIENRQQKHERFDVPFMESFLLHPGTLACVPTLEWVRIPKNLQGIVTTRSSWAREGLNIATATIINPGYQGIITLELANFGEIPIRLHPGLRIAQIALYELRVPPESTEQQQLSQFHLAFEPEAGNISKGDEKFIPS